MARNTIEAALLDSTGRSITLQRPHAFVYLLETKAPWQTEAFPRLFDEQHKRLAEL